MNKMLVAVFKNEPLAFEGLSALKGLHKDGDISLHATAVLSKDAAGKVSMRQSVDAGPIGTTLGMLTGSMLGLLAGPVGLALGASMGGLTGLMFDLDRSGIDLQFVDDVAKALGPGKAAVLAEVDETWTTPVDSRIAKLDGMVFRRLRSEVIEDQLAREAAAFKSEATQLREELAHAQADSKAAIQKQIDGAKNKLRATEELIRARNDQIRRESEAKMAAMQEQLRQASDRQKAKIEKRMADVKADLASRGTKLQEAGRLIKEALAA